MSLETLVIRLRHVPPMAYLFVSMSLVGAVSEVCYHFLPPAAIPPFNFWLLSLSQVDHDFFYLLWELLAHVCIGVGLIGIVTVVVYRYMNEAGTN